MAAGPVSIVVMGTQGTGKSTLGALLAARLGVPFIDGDDLHPPRNVERMSQGIPLDDLDREPWLHRVGEVLAGHRDAGGVVVACSALKRAYRDIIRSHAPETYFAEAHGPIELIAARVGARDHEYMPATLLQSQYDTLEPLDEDEHGIRVSVEPSPHDIVDALVDDYQQKREVRA